MEISLKSLSISISIDICFDSCSERSRCPSPTTLDFIESPYKVSITSLAFGNAKCFQLSQTSFDLMRLCFTY